MEAPPCAEQLDPREVPPAVRALVETLGAAGHAGYLVGGCVRDLLQGRAVADFDVATSAPPPLVLELFPRAVPIGLRHGTVMIPTESGPVDVTTFRNGNCIERDLAHRDFTCNALAYDPRRGVLLDPFDGRNDLAQGRLRAVRSARDRFAEDPLRALRAARLAATLDLAPDPELESAMAETRQALGRVARERIRQELSLLLLGRRAERGLTLLRRSGIEERLVPGAAPDAAPVVAALPAQLELRLAAWLRGARAASILRRLRFSRRSAERVERLVRLHPIDARVDAARDASVRGLIKRAGEENLPALLALRRAELEAGSARDEDGAGAAGLRALEEAIQRVRQAGFLALRRYDLALDGKEVMRLLGCGPGPEVGRALRYLTDRVVEDPACNTPAGLRALLERWGDHAGSS